MMDRQPYKPALQSLGLFESCSPDELQIVEALIEVRTFSPGEVIVRAGEPFPLVGSIQEGLAIVRSYDAKGGEAILAFLLPTDLIGKPDDTPSRFDIVAAGRMRVSCMSLRHFMHVIRAMPSVTMNATSRALDRLELVQDWIVKANQLDAKGRLVSLIALMALRNVQAGLCDPDAPVILKIPVSREVIGNLLGLGLYTVSRLMGKLKAEGLFDADEPHQIRIPDFRRLLCCAGCADLNEPPSIPEMADALRAPL